MNHQSWQYALLRVNAVRLHRVLLMPHRPNLVYKNWLQNNGMTFKGYCNLFTIVDTAGADLGFFVRWSKFYNFEIRGGG